MGIPALRQSCFIANPTSTTYTYSVTFGSAVLAGDLLICTVRCGQQPTTNVSDSVNGAWARLGTFVSNSSNSGGMWWVISAAGTPTVTIANTSLVSFGVQAKIDEYINVSGLRNFGQIARAGVTTSTGTTPNAAATAVTGDLIVVGIFNETNNTPPYSAGVLSGVTGTLTMGSVASNQNADNEYAVATSSGSTITATATDGSVTWDMGIAVFIPSAIGAAQGPSLMQFGLGM